MRTITCKKCGATIDASLGECPNCGAVYYILPGDDLSAQAVFSKAPAPERDSRDFTQNVRLAGAESDDIFNTGVWKTRPDADATMSFIPLTQARGVPQPARVPQRRPIDFGEPARRNQPPRGRGMSYRTKTLIVVALALVAALTLVIFISSGAGNMHKKDERLEMPDIVGREMIESSATALLEGMGVQVKTQAEFGSAPEGTVIRQSKKAGTLLKRGETITLTISLGIKDDGGATAAVNPVEVTVPNLVGKSYTQAEKELISLGLYVRRGEDQFSDEKEGSVISQNPARGSVVNKGDIVLLIVSKGLEPTPSPAGFKIIVTAGAGGTVTPKGVVIVKEGESMTFDITPAAGYSVREVKVDGVDVGPVTSHTFENVDKDHSLYIVFQVDMGTPSPTQDASVQTPEISPTPYLPVGG